MRLALACGERGLGKVWPNPSVGCIVVLDGRVIARGRTSDGGRPHAEAVAVASATQPLTGATAYVSLEPCSHTGETGPCAKLLADSGIARVVTAMADPDRRVAGTGHEWLKQAGIAVETNCLKQEAVRSHLGFLLTATIGRPMITLKLAHTLDGKVATSSGDSKWITGPSARALVHALRARHDAVLVGRGTAVLDDPDLTPRHTRCDNVPVRIILDTKLSTSPDGILGRTTGTGPVWICHAANAPESNRAAWLNAGAETVQCKSARHGGLDLTDTLDRLASRGITRVLCEGGPELAASFVRANLVDCFVGFSAGMALGSDALSMLGSLECNSIGDAKRMELIKLRRIGGDIVCTWSRPIGSYQVEGRQLFC